MKLRILFLLLLLSGVILNASTMYTLSGINKLYLVVEISGKTVPSSYKEMILDNLKSTTDELKIDTKGYDPRSLAVLINERVYNNTTVVTVQLVIGEVMYNGRDYDLSMLSADISEWTAFGTDIHEGNAIISINGNEIFSQSYTQGIGLLKGIKIRFFGSGQARRIQLNDGSGEVIFMDDFESD